MRSGTRVGTPRLGAPLRSQDLARLQSQYLQQIEPPQPGRANFVRYVLKMMTEKSYAMLRDQRVQALWRKHLPDIVRRKAKFNNELGLDPQSVLAMEGEPFGLLLVAYVQVSNMGMGPVKARTLHSVVAIGIGHDPLDAMIHGFDEPGPTGTCSANPSRLQVEAATNSFSIPRSGHSVSSELFWLRGMDLEILVKPTLAELAAMAKSLKY
jgi:hypothetical protein